MNCQASECSNEAVVEYQPLEAGDSESQVGLNWPRDKWVAVCEWHRELFAPCWVRHPDGHMEMLRKKR